MYIALPSPGVCCSREPAASTVVITCLVPGVCKCWKTTHLSLHDKRVVSVACTRTCHEAHASTRAARFAATTRGFGCLRTAAYGLAQACKLSQHRLCSQIEHILCLR
jgi:hypothetical protein